MTKKTKLVEALFKETQEQQQEKDLKYLLEDAETDLKRAIESGEKEVSKLERSWDQKVKEYVLGGPLNAVLQFSRDIDAKTSDVERLKKIREKYF